MRWYGRGHHWQLVPHPTLTAKVCHAPFMEKYRNACMRMPPLGQSLQVRYNDWSSIADYKSANYTLMLKGLTLRRLNHVMWLRAAQAQVESQREGNGNGNDKGKGWSIRGKQESRAIRKGQYHGQTHR